MNWEKPIFISITVISVSVQNKSSVSVMKSTVASWRRDSSAGQARLNIAHRDEDNMVKEQMLEEEMREMQVELLKKMIRAEVAGECVIMFV
jgi:hypothetical protein